MRNPSFPNSAHTKTCNSSCITNWPYLNDKVKALADDELHKILSYDRLTVLNLIKSCQNEKNTRKAQRIHVDIVKKNLLTSDVFIATALITAYSRCGALDEAREVFDQLAERDVIAWNALIAAYAQNGHGEEALKCLQQMCERGTRPNAVTYSGVLKACGLVGSLEIGEGIDAEVRKQGLLHKDIVLGTALVDMYMKCGAPVKAQEVFEQLPQPNVVSWSALIAGYAQNGLGEEALKCFKQMKDAGFYPDVITYICILKACSIVGSLKVGEDIDVEIRKKGLLEKHVVLGNALVDMYSKCGLLEKAREVFEQLPKRNVVSWNALISGYTQNGLGEEALKCFQEMRNGRICPDVVTYISILKSCSMVRSLEIGQEIDVEVRKQGLLEKDIVLGTALMDMYFKCGALVKAREVFWQLPKHNVVSWSALIDGHVQNGLGDEALECYRQMQDKGVSPNEVTYICILKACGIVGSLETGEDIGAKFRNQELLQQNVVLGNALLDMYCRCGSLRKASEVFWQLPEHNVVSWSTLMSGYGQLGKANVALGMYERMKTGDVAPNLVTFVVLLNSCSHAGLVNEGEQLFNEMRVVYNLTATLEHYTCMIDLFGRAGNFNQVKILLDEVSCFSHLPLFKNILGSCRKWVNVNLGRWAFQQSIWLDVNCVAAYVCMRDIYTLAGMQTEADKIEHLRVKNNAWKNSGYCCWIDSNGKMHSFAVSDQDHSHNMDLCGKLANIYQKLLQECHFVGQHWISPSISYDQKGNMLCDHGEKLAIAYALINTCDSASIHVIKGLQSCGKCHSAIELLSRIVKRKIILKDTNRVHVFEDGRCVCTKF